MRNLSQENLFSRLLRLPRIRWARIVEPFKLSEATLRLLSSSLNVYSLTETKQKEFFHWGANLARCLKIFRFQRRRGIQLSQFLANFIAKDKL